MERLIIGVLLACLALQAACYARKKRENQKQIDGLIEYLTLVQDRMELPQMDQFREGRLSILQSEIYKVVILLKEAYKKEAGQKQELADFFSDISHQIKTPVSAISIMAELLEGPQLSDELRMEYAAKIDQQASRIGWLVRKLLLLAQLEADVLEFKRERVDLSEILQSIEGTLEIMAEVKGVRLVCQEGVSITLSCDRHWLTEALLNIAKNCLEHTPEGGTVWISASWDNVSVNLHIRDNGEGIGEEQLPHIFERFYKDTAGSTSGGDSVGIGLALAKQMILKQNGTIAVTSTKGKGTDFLIRLFRTDTL